MVAGRLLLFVGAVLLLIDHDEPEVLDGREESRTRADHDARLAVANPRPFAPTVAVGLRRVENRGGAPESLLNGARGGGGEPDLGYQDDTPATRRKDRFETSDVDLGLARSGDAVEEEGCIAARGGRGVDGGYGDRLLVGQLMSNGAGGKGPARALCLALAEALDQTSVGHGLERGRGAPCLPAHLARQRRAGLGRQPFEDLSLARRTAALLEQVLEGFRRELHRHDFDLRSSITTPAPNADPPGLHGGVEGSAGGEPGADEQSRDLEPGAGPQNLHDGALCRRELLGADPGAGRSELCLLGIGAKEPCRDHGRQGGSQRTTVVAGYELGDIHQPLREERRLVEDLLNGADGVDWKLGLVGDGDDDAGRVAVAERHPHPNAGYGEWTQFFRDAVGERLGCALWDGDADKHRS